MVAGGRLDPEWRAGTAGNANHKWSVGPAPDDDGVTGYRRVDRRLDRAKRCDGASRRVVRPDRRDVPAARPGIRIARLDEQRLEGDGWKRLRAAGQERAHTP